MNIIVCYVCYVGYCAVEKVIKFMCL